jgi:hypothetical protein
MTDLYVRADVWDLAPNDPVITAYAGAVAAMQARNSNPSDPTSWAFQAAMHGLQNGSPPTPPANQCQHASWYFLPWHRMYLYYFERIVRAQVIADGGPATWALPYWNYDAGGDANKLPPAFRDPASALYVAQRAPGFNDGTAGLPTGPNGITSAWGGGGQPPSTCRRTPVRASSAAGRPTRRSSSSTRPRPGSWRTPRTTPCTTRWAARAA